MSGKTIALRVADKSNAHIDPSREFDSWEEEFGFWGYWGYFQGPFSSFLLPLLIGRAISQGGRKKRREKREG